LDFGHRILFVLRNHLVEISDHLVLEHICVIFSPFNFRRISQLFDKILRNRLDGYVGYAAVQR